MTKSLLLLLSLITLHSGIAHAQIRRGTGLLKHSHEQAFFYVRNTTLTIKPENREQFIQATHALQAKGVSESGCLEYRYYEDPATRNNFLLVSEWATAAAMESYYRQPYVIDYFEKIASWLAEPATVRVHETVKHQVTTIPAKP